MSKNIFPGAFPALAAVAAMALAGCGGVSELTKQRVARGETAVRQAQQAVGNSEAGAVELQNARNHLQQAQEALNDEKDKEAFRHAQRAELNAELAVAESQSAAARNAANELLASVQALRKEAERGSEVATDQQ